MTDRQVTWVNTREIAAHLGIHHSTVRRHVEAGRIPGHRITPKGPWRFDKVEVDEWLRSQSASTAA